MDSRLKQIRKQLGLKQEELAGIFECGKHNISMIERGKSALSERNKKCLVKKFNLNPLWLEGENAPMLLPAAEHAARLEESPAIFPASVPLYDMEQVPSLAGLFKYTAANPSHTTGRVGRRSENIGKPGRPTKEQKAYTPVGWISVPGLPKCDGALKLAGDGMEPILRGGDIVLYSRLGSVAEIFWGEMYLLSVDTPMGDYIAVRYLHRSEKPGLAVLTGENSGFRDTEIELSKIRAIAFVKATVRMNSSK
uniref:Putative peptidase S24/LexA repressor family protein n=2 Tax=termite gut metagenome TaxID=433724 RepID=S0DF90_9ZZZZ